MDDRDVLYNRLYPSPDIRAKREDEPFEPIVPKVRKRYKRPHIYLAQWEALLEQVSYYEGMLKQTANRYEEDKKLVYKKYASTYFPEPIPDKLYKMANNRYSRNIGRYSRYLKTANERLDIAYNNNQAAIAYWAAEDNRIEDMCNKYHMRPDKFYNRATDRPKENDD